MFVITLLAALLWFGAGVLLLRWKTKAIVPGADRSVSRSILTVGTTVRVALQLTPPARKELTAQPHDVVLVLDQSSSMGDGPGSALWGAIRAAENFVRRCPPSIRIGLIGFNGTALTLSLVTEDHSAVLRALGSIGGGDGTAIDSALAAALDVIAATDRSDVRKTVILLSDGGSDRTRALARAERLRELAKIVAIGFGDVADAGLLREVAGPTGHYCHVREANDLSELFSVLAAFVGGEMTVTGLIEERAHAPSPFQLTNTGALNPVAVASTPLTNIIWSVPVMDPRAVTLTYDLIAECPGWHEVARRGSQVVWRLPDGTQQMTALPAGPRVLVLPALLGWAWPVLNPLFWLLFGRLFCGSNRAAAGPMRMPELEPEHLALPSLPRPLAPPQPVPYVPKVKPALVIGLGEAGEWALRHLSHILADRNVESDNVTLLAVRAGSATREPLVGASATVSMERIDFEQDLRPYLESVRAGGASPSRGWIPVTEWLGRMGPRTTAWIEDRREARLALLQRPQGIEDRVAAAVRKLKSDGGDVAPAIVVGAALDLECSGLLAEMGHVLAVEGAQNTAVVVMPAVSNDSRSDEVEAFARELERMLLMRGDEVLSDRHEPSLPARQLLDRLVVLREDATGAQIVGQEIANFIWHLLAYPAVFRKIPTARAVGQHVECSVVEGETIHLPAESLWLWIRNQALAKAIDGFWLDLQVADHRLKLPPAPREDVHRAVAAFWAATTLARPQGLLIHSGNALRASSGDSNLLTVQARLPVGALYEEQADFADRERRTSAAFIEEWAQSVLDESYQKRKWGLATLVSAVREIEAGIVAIQQRLQEASANPRMVAARLGIALYSDLASYLEGYRRTIEGWIGEITGTQLDFGVVAASADPLCDRIERAWRDADASIRFPTDAVRKEAIAREAAWYQRYGNALLEQLRFRHVREGRRARITLELAGKEIELERGTDLLGELAAYFATFRAEVLAWPLHESLDTVVVGQPSARSRIGAAGSSVYPSISAVLDDADPHIVAMMRIEYASLDDALRVRRRGWNRLPYAWPEEANAVRVATLVHNRLERLPEPFPPMAVHLLRDTAALRAFFADVAEGSVTFDAERCFVSREGTAYWVGPASLAMSPDEALLNFQRIARQVALLKRSLDARPIPDRVAPWAATPDDAVWTIEASSLVHPAVAADGWKAWKDIIRGVTLDRAQPAAM